MINKSSQKLEVGLKSLALQSEQLESKKTPVQLLQGFISACDQILAFSLISPKVSVPCLWAGCTLQTALPGEGSTQKLPATLGDQFAQLPQSPAEFYTPFQDYLYQIQYNHHNTPNAFIMGEIQTLPPEIPTGCSDLWTNHIACQRQQQERGQGAPEDLIIFSSCDNDLICKALRTRTVFQRDFLVLVFN